MSLSKLKSFLGRATLYVTKDNHVVSKNALGTGGEGSPGVILPGSGETTAIFDDFAGDTGRTALLAANTDTWRLFNGDTGGTAIAALQPSTNGVLRFDQGPNPVEQIKFGISGSTNWKGNMGSAPTENKNPVRVSARIRHEDTGSSKTNWWVGFTDTVVAEVPVMDTGGAVVSVATNAVGIGYSNRGEGDTGIVGYAVNGDTNRTPVVLDTGYTEGKYVTVEVAISHGVSDTGGTATFYVDGVPKGKIAAPVAMNVALAPQVLFWGDTGGSATLDIDYVNVSGPRDTGL